MPGSGGYREDRSNGSVAYTYLRDVECRTLRCSLTREGTMSVEDVTHRLMIENAEQCGKFAGVIDCAIIAIEHNDVARALRLLREVQEAYDAKRDADVARIEATIHAPII